MIHSLLRAHRNSNHLTQKEMAAKLGITREYYSRLERGVATPSFPLFETLCAVLKLQALELAHRLGDSKQKGMVPPICDLCSKLSRQQRQAVKRMMKAMTLGDRVTK